MKLRVVSDLHFEFHADGGAALVDEIAAGPSCDAVVVAGDLSPLHGLSAALTRLHSRFSRVIYVAGNHEAYGASVEALDYHRRHGQRPLVQWLECHTLVCRDTFLSRTGAEPRVVLGCTLWFPHAPHVSKDGMVDFRAIRDAEPAIYEANHRAVEFLRRELRAGDIVVTHHLPSWRSVAPRFAGSRLNAFFVCDLEDLIEERQPALWIHGHTHTSCDYLIGETRVLCNPFGYVGVDLNPTFDPHLTVEV